MLEELTITNYAIIDNLTLSFTPGLNVLTGETGAGKSILVGALGLLLGQKSDPTVIRTGAEEVCVSGIVRPEMTEELEEWLSSHEIETEEGTLLIRRSVKQNGRGSIFVQSAPVLRSDLEGLSSFLFDMHSQHEHQSLFNTDNHRKLLDRYGKLNDDVREFKSLFTELSDAREKYQSLLKEESDRAKELDWLEFAVKEIDQAKLKPGEEEELAERQRILSQSEVIIRHLNRFQSLMGESRNGALAMIREAMDSLENLNRIDSKNNSLMERLTSAFYEIEDITTTITQYEESVSFSADELQHCDDRLALINKFEKKYGPTVTDILNFAENSRKKMESLVNGDKILAELKENQSRLQSRVRDKAQKLSAGRKAAAEKLEKDVVSILKELGMENADFRVQVELKTDSSGNPSCGLYGWDKIEFLLSANRGEALKPLKSVASGGEISRVMLALKSVLNEADTVGTLVFDEIDTGIGGKIGRSLGKYLKKLSEYKQIFSITHLASIAVFADNHMRVEKNDSDGRTSAQVITVKGDSRKAEIARMLSGDMEGEISLAHAEELLKQSGA